MKYFTVSGGHANRKVEHKLAHCGVSRGTSGTSEPLHDNDGLTHINHSLRNVLEADTVQSWFLPVTRFGHFRPFPLVENLAELTYVDIFLPSHLVYHGAETNLQSQSLKEQLRKWLSIKSDNKYVGTCGK